MKRFFSCLAFAVAASAANNASALSLDDIKCYADGRGAGRIEFSPTRTMGAPPDEKIDFHGAKLAVGFGQGDRFEPQQVLSIEIDSIRSTIYSPKESLYMLEANGVRLQCSAFRLGNDR